VAGEALAAISAILTDPKAPAAVRLRAALAILEKASAPLPAIPEELAGVDTQEEPPEPAPKTRPQPTLPLRKRPKIQTLLPGEPAAEGKLNPKAVQIPNPNPPVRQKTASASEQAKTKPPATSHQPLATSR